MLEKMEQVREDEEVRMFTPWNEEEAGGERGGGEGEEENSMSADIIDHFSEQLTTE